MSQYQETAVAVLSRVIGLTRGRSGRRLDGVLQGYPLQVRRYAPYAHLFSPVVCPLLPGCRGRLCVGCWRRRGWRRGWG